MNRSTDQDPATARPGSVAPGFAAARLIAVSMVMGVAMMWVVAWFVTQGNAGAREGAVGISPRLGFLIWAALAIGTFAAMMMFRGRALAMVDDARRSGGAAEVAARSGPIQTLLIICFALIEAPALFAGVMLILTGSTTLLLYAAPIYVLGVALTFPRAEWFGSEARRG